MVALSGFLAAGLQHDLPPVLPLELAGVTVHRRGKRLLGPVSLRLEGQGITIVLGPNGSGKTTLLQAMHGLARISGGSIRWAVPEVAARSRQALVFQTPILMRRSVRDCIAYPLRLDGWSRQAARESAAAVAARLGLGALLDRPAGVLSGGERQKMALARALIRAPEVLFLDEPCANLDGRSTRDIEAILREVRAGGTRIVMSTHDIGQARRLADEVLFIHDGRLHEAGRSPAIFDAPGTAELEAYLKGDLLI